MRLNIDGMMNKNFLLNLIASEDRYDFSNFLHEMDRARDMGLLEDDHFALFRNGFVVNQIVKLKDARKVIGRELQPAELLDKVNYLSILRDIESLNTAYTNDTIIDGLCNNDRDFSWWFTCGTMSNLPIEVRNNIAMKLLSKGEIEKAKCVLQTIEYTLSTTRGYDDNKRRNSR